MEGRTIARPNDVDFDAASHCMTLLQWRAGQLPGQTWICQPSVVLRVELQWRAGQLPGQTNRHHRGLIFGDPPDIHASMEGRTIARPNNEAVQEIDRSDHASMEGRTIARPNVPDHMAASVLATLLQWRAGQLPGQTSNV